MNEFINLIYAAEQFGIAVTLLVVSFSVVYFFGKTLENKIRRVRRLKNEVAALVALVREKEARILSLQNELSERIIEANNLRREIDDLNDQEWLDAPLTKEESESLRNHKFGAGIDMDSCTRKEQ